MYPYIETAQAITTVIDGKPHAVTKDNNNYESIVDFVMKQTPSAENDETLLDLIKPINSFVRIMGEGNSGFILEDSVLRCEIDGEVFPLPQSLYSQVLKVYKAKGNLSPLYNFVLKLSRNPRKEVIDELWSFISSCGLAITEQGNFLAYKNVNNNFMDVYTNTMSNAPGTVLTMPRWKVEHNPDKTCAPGLHFAAWGYLKSYAPGRKTVLLSISPEDVVSIPTDYNNMKGRACRYKVLREVDQPEELKDVSIYNESDELVDTSESDSTWIKWSKEDRKSGSEPEDFNSVVEVRFKDGVTATDEVQHFQWYQIPNKAARIVAYRIIEE